MRGRIRREVIVRAPVRRVFAFLSDLARVPEWDQRVEKVVQMTRGPLRPGVILRTTIAVGDEIHSADDEITVYEPPNRFGLRSVLGGTDEITYTLAEEDTDLTLVSVVLSYEIPVPEKAAGVNAAQVQRSIEAALSETLKLLGKIVESEH